MKKYRNINGLLIFVVPRTNLDFHDEIYRKRKNYYTNTMSKLVSKELSDTPESINLSKAIFHSVSNKQSYSAVSVFHFPSEVHYQPCGDVSVNVNVTITTNACVEGGCSKHGRCINFLNSHVLFTTCRCDAGKSL